MRTGPPFNVSDNEGNTLVYGYYANYPVSTNFSFYLNETPVGYQTSQINAWQYCTRIRSYINAIEARNSLSVTHWVIDLHVNNPDPMNGPGGAAYADADDVRPRIVVSRKTNLTYSHAASSAFYHEYGHYVVFEVTGIYDTPFTHSHAHHEAIADVWDCFFLDDAINGQKQAIGLPNSYRRNIDDGKQMSWEYNSQTQTYSLVEHTGFGIWPAPSFDPHEQGMPISGTWWDLRKKLIVSFPTTGKTTAEDLVIRYLDRRKQLNQPLPPPSLSIYNDVLVVDDNPYFGGDNNLANGTPHKTLIQDAFAEHNLFLKPFIRGDVDQNGVVNPTDATRIGQYLQTPPTYIPQCLDAADADDNGKVESADQLYILNYY